MILEKLISGYLEMCEFQNNLDRKTVKAYRIDLFQFSEFVGGENVFYSKEMVVHYIHYLNSKNYKVKTVKRKIASVKAFLSYLSYEEIIEMNPFYKIRLKMKEPLVLPKTIPVEVLNDLFQFVYDEKKGCEVGSYKEKEITRDLLVLELLVGTGMRISELCSLKKSDIDIKENSIKIYGKGAKERVLPVFNDSIWHLVKEYEGLYGKSLSQNDYFFINKFNNKLSDQSVRNMIAKYSLRAGISINITPHMFRHTFATMLLESNVDTRYIQQLLGHSNITTTQIYTHITSNKKSEIMKLKNPRDKLRVNKG